MQGTVAGDVHVYNTQTGVRVTTVDAVRVKAPVRACALSQDCRHLLSVLGNGFVFRYEYMPNTPVALITQVGFDSITRSVHADAAQCGFYTLTAFGLQDDEKENIEVNVDACEMVTE